MLMVERNITVTEISTGKVIENITLAEGVISVLRDLRQKYDSYLYSVKWETTRTYEFYQEGTDWL